MAISLKSPNRGRLAEASRGKDYRAPWRFRLSTCCSSNRRQRHETVLAELWPIDLAGHPPGAHHADAVAQTKKLEKIGGYDQHRCSFRGQLSDQIVDLDLGSNIDAARWLIEQENAGRNTNCAGKDDLLLITA